MLIPYTESFDLTHSLESGQAFRWRRDDGAVEDGFGPWYFGVIFNNIVKIRHCPGGLEFFTAPDHEAAMQPLVHDYLRLHDDIGAIYAEICQDNRIQEGVTLYTGMRIQRQEPWENLVSFICSANNNIARISKNVEDMSNSFGRPISMDGYVRSSFPTPGDIVEAGEQKLRDLGLGFRAKYVAATANIIAEGKLDLFSLREASYDEALEALTSLTGVGDKVANCVLLFSLDKLEAFPVDVWIDRALREWYLTDDDQKMSRAKMRPWAQQRFGQYAGYANQYMFHGRRLQKD